MQTVAHLLPLPFLCPHLPPHYPIATPMSLLFLYSNVGFIPV